MDICLAPHLKHGRQVNFLRKEKRPLKKNRNMGRYLFALGFVALAILPLTMTTSQASGYAVPNDGTENLPPGTTIETLLPGMHLPIAMTFDPTGRLFYIEKDGGVRLYANGVLQANPVLTITVDSSGEQGLLGITLDPNFSSNHLVYVYYTCLAGSQGCPTKENRIARFVETNGVGSGLTTIFTSPNSTGSTNHNGGNIHFGPDSKLYVTIGEDATPSYSQDVGEKRGKIHRMNADGSIPADNPVFTQTGALPTLYAMGLRNSFDFDFDPYTAMSPYPRIFASENGPSCDDEMNRIEATYNYGWRASYPCGDASPQYNTIPHLWWLGPGGSGACCEAPVGVIVYDGSQIPQWQGGVFMTANSSGLLRHHYLNADRTAFTTTNVVNGVSAGMDLEVGPDGAFYYMEGGGYTNGTLKRIVGPGGGATATATNVPPSATRTSTSVPPSSTSTRTNTAVASATRTNTPVVPSPTRTSTGTVVLPSATSTNPPQPTSTTPPNPTASATTTACTIQFTDVPPGHPFYTYVRCLACQGVLSGYPCGGPGEPCDENNNPYFRPFNNITRGQIAKVVSNAAGLAEDPGPQVYADVPTDHPFYIWINRLSNRGYMGGYPCGGPGEPCDDQQRPYFRPYNNATRGQLSKIVSNAANYSDPVTTWTFQDVPPDHPFYVWVERLAGREIIGGYSCGTDPGEPCVPPDNRPYFRPGNDVTRGQASKIVAGTFSGSCPTPPVDTFFVEIRDFEYKPANLVVPLGTTVRWFNYDLDYHTSTSGPPGQPDGVFDSGNINQFDSWAFTFNTPGTYEYYCRPHPYMVASITVTP